MPKPGEADSASFAEDLSDAGGKAYRAAEGNLFVAASVALKHIQSLLAARGSACPFLDLAVDSLSMSDQLGLSNELDIRLAASFSEDLSDRLA